MLTPPFKYIRALAAESGVDTGTFVTILTQLQNTDNKALKILSIEWEWINCSLWPGAVDISASFALFRGPLLAGPSIASPGCIYANTIYKVGTAAAATDVFFSPNGKWVPEGDLLVGDETMTLFVTSALTGLAQNFALRIGVEVVNVSQLEKTQLLKAL